MCVVPGRPVPVRAEGGGAAARRAKKNTDKGKLRRINFCATSECFVSHALPWARPSLHAAAVAGGAVSVSGMTLQKKSLDLAQNMP